MQRRVAQGGIGRAADLRSIRTATSRQQDPTGALGTGAGTEGSDGGQRRMPDRRLMDAELDSLERGVFAS